MGSFGWKSMFFMTILLMNEVCSLENMMVLIESDAKGEYQTSGQDLKSQDGGDHLTSPYPTNDVKIIWNQNLTNSPAGETVIVQEKFNVFCDAPLHLLARADDEHTAYINGVQVSQTVTTPGSCCEQSSTWINPKDVNLNLCG